MIMHAMAFYVTVDFIDWRNSQNHSSDNSSKYVYKQINQDESFYWFTDLLHWFYICDEFLIMSYSLKLDDCSENSQNIFLFLPGISWIP